MGHELLQIGKNVKAVRDLDMLLLRHSLSRGAEELGICSLYNDIDGWSYHGPGVWTNVNIEVLRNQDALFKKVEETITDFGSSIPSEYLKVIEGSGIKFIDVKTTRLTGLVRDIRQFVEDNI